MPETCYKLDHDRGWLGDSCHNLDQPILSLQPLSTRGEVSQTGSNHWHTAALQGDTRRQHPSKVADRIG